MPDIDVLAASDVPINAVGSPLPVASQFNCDASIKKRFWAKVRRGLANECWEWTACKDEKGYGRFRVGGRLVQSHRVARMFDTGEWTNPELMVLHSCDNPSCCNPAHLREGTAAENNQECIEKGRRNTWGRTGTANWKTPTSENILRGGSKLSPWDVRQIREMCEDRAQIPCVAEKFGVRKSVIYDILRRRTFRWVVGKGY